MKLLAAAALCALFAGCSARRAPVPPPAPPQWLGDPGMDIQLARSHAREAQNAGLQWELANTVAEYERVGKKDPRWDADARAALDGFARVVAKQRDPDALSAAARAACQRALDAGCDDPLIVYVGLRLIAPPPGTTPAAVAQQYARAEAPMEASGYSPWRKLFSSLRSAEQASKATPRKTAAGAPPPPPPPGTDTAASFTRARTHLVEVMRDPHVPRPSLYEIADVLFEASRRDAAGPASVLEPMAKTIDAGELAPVEGTATVKLCEGLFWTSYAWQARTGAWAKDVSPEGFQRFEARLAKAQDALEKAYALDPAETLSSLQMMTVELGQGQGLDRLNLWFRRAMDADPDSYRACESKLHYLEPKWYGSPEAMLAFGRECVATQNWPARLPFILLDAHTRLASYQDNPLAYWKRPEVWNDVQALYKAALAAAPDSVFDRSGYALYAYRAEQWKLADEMFNALGERANLRALDCTAAQYASMRRQAAARAAGR